jgi:hypothetical protein
MVVSLRIAPPGQAAGLGISRPSRGTPGILQRHLSAVKPFRARFRLSLVSLTVELWKVRPCFGGVGVTTKALRAATPMAVCEFSGANLSRLPSWRFKARASPRHPPSSPDATALVAGLGPALPSSAVSHGGIVMERQLTADDLQKRIDRLAGCSRVAG